VRFVRWWRRHYAHSLVVTRPSYLAGLAAWDIADGRVASGRRLLERAIAECRRRHFDGELHDVHLLFARIFPAGSREASEHAGEAARLAAEMARKQATVERA
jgi:hypothetical protein